MRNGNDQNDNLSKDKSDNDGSVLFRGDRMLQIIKDEYVSDRAMLRDLNETMGRPRNSPFPPIPLNQTERILSDLGLTIRKLYELADIPEIISKEDEQFLKRIDRLSEFELTQILQHLMQLDGGWYNNNTSKGGDYAFDRLYAHVHHHNLERFREYRVKYRLASKRELPKEEYPKMYIGWTTKVVPSGVSLELDYVPEIANIVGTSTRWLSGWPADQSFYGYSPEAECVFDLYKLLPETRKTIVEYIINNSV